MGKRKEGERACLQAAMVGEGRETQFVPKTMTQFEARRKQQQLAS